VLSANSELVRILDVDPELGYQLEPPDRERARRLAVARLQTIPAGRWAPTAEWDDQAGHLGLLVVDGLVARTIGLGHTTCSELLGQRDILRPWNEDCGFTVGELDAAWTVLEELRVAVLDHRFAAIAGRWPAIIDVLLSRLVLRSRCLTFHLAVTRLNRVDVRLLVTLWFLAERWGRVTAEGVLLPLRLTHQILAQLIGARRPSVTTAAGELTSAGLASRRPDGSWVLHGQPPDDLRAVRRRVGLASGDGDGAG
jgi:CRP/FNR family transcriptional regulator, cyclic AMP receptor protein